MQGAACFRQFAEILQFCVKNSRTKMTYGSEMTDHSDSNREMSFLPTAAEKRSAGSKSPRSA